MSNQIRDLVHTIKTSDLTPAQISAAFGEIYLSRDTIENQLESQEIVTQSRLVKSPFYGQHIPNTAQIVDLAGDSGIQPFFTPDSNKTYEFMGADVMNQGVSNLDVAFGLTDGVLFLQLDNQVPVGSQQLPFDPKGLRYFDSSVYPAILVLSGTGSDAMAQLAYAEVIQ